jgi:hypothetical protein
MNQSTLVVFIFILVLIALIALAFFGTSFLMKRATRLIIKSLRYNEALTPESAIMAEDAGIKRKSMFQLGLLRDYKPTAFQFLVKNNIVRLNEEGKIYLSEETLTQSGIEQKIK